MFLLLHRLLLLLLLLAASGYLVFAFLHCLSCFLLPLFHSMIASSWTLALAFALGHFETSVLLWKIVCLPYNWGSSLCMAGRSCPHIHSSTGWLARWQTRTSYSIAGACYELWGTCNPHPSSTIRSHEAHCCCDNRPLHEVDLNMVLAMIGKLYHLLRIRTMSKCTYETSIEFCMCRFQQFSDSRPMNSYRFHKMMLQTTSYYGIIHFSFHQTVPEMNKNIVFKQDYSQLFNKDFSFWIWNLTEDFRGRISGLNLFSLLKERRARWVLTAVWALKRACILWRVAAALFLTRNPLTTACSLTSPLRARRAFLAWP